MIVKRESWMPDPIEGMATYRHFILQEAPLVAHVYDSDEALKPKLVSLANWLRSYGDGAQTAAEEAGSAPDVWYWRSLSAVYRALFEGRLAECWQTVRSLVRQGEEG